MDLNKVIDQENRLIFSRFDNELALDIVKEINRYVKKNYEKPVGIQIYFDDKIVLHFLMEGRKESPWLERKRKTVLKSGHSTLYLFYKQEDPLYIRWNEDDSLALGGGGFPIIVDGNLRGAICVSGLDHFEDHKIITEVLSQVLKRKENGEV